MSDEFDDKFDAAGEESKIGEHDDRVPYARPERERRFYILGDLG